MAKYEDYLPKGENDPSTETKELDQEVQASEKAQEERRSTLGS